MNVLHIAVLQLGVWSHDMFRVIRMLAHLMWVDAQRNIWGISLSVLLVRSLWEYLSPNWSKEDWRLVGNSLIQRHLTKSAIAPQLIPTFMTVFDPCFWLWVLGHTVIQCCKSSYFYALVRMEKLITLLSNDFSRHKLGVRVKGYWNKR